MVKPGLVPHLDRASGVPILEQCPLPSYMRTGPWGDILAVQPWAQLPRAPEVPQSLIVRATIGKELAFFVPVATHGDSAGNRQESFEGLPPDTPSLQPGPDFVSGSAHACLVSFLLFQAVLSGAEVQHWTSCCLSNLCLHYLPLSGLHCG